MPTQGEGEELASLPVAEAFPDDIVVESIEVEAIMGMTPAMGLGVLSLFLTM